MLSKNVIKIFAAAMVLLTGCTSAPKVDVRAEADAIRKLEDEWAAAMRAGEVDKIVGYFATDGVSMPANKPIVSGTQAIRKDETASYSDTTNVFSTYSSKIDALEVSASGDLAFVRGSDQQKQKTAKGLINEPGKWIDVWKKIDGKWKVIASTWNDDRQLAKL